MEWAAVLARNVHRGLPPSFQIEDLIGEAHVELWKRAQSYDPAKSDRDIPVNPDGACQLRRCAFEGYAYQAVRGACLMACRRRHYIENTHESLSSTSERPRPSALIQKGNSQDGVRSPGALAVPRDERYNPEQVMLARAEAVNARRRFRRKREAVEGLIRQLPAFDGYLVTRVYMEGAAVEDVARTWAQPKEVFARRLTNAVRRLKKARG